jgi:SNF2 family DNA or RNA helicase
MKATATIVDGKIAVRTEAPGSAFEVALEMCKEVGGGRWHKASKTWRYALSLDTCHRLRTVWGKHLEVAQPLREWYTATNVVADLRAQAASVGDATLTRLPEAAPALAATLRADQRVAATWLAEGWRGSALLADHPGTGKTLCTIAAMLEADVQGPILITCPRLSVRPVWARELARWTDEKVYVARGTRKQREAALAAFAADPAQRKWLIIVAEMLRVKEELDPEDPEGKKKIFAGYEFPELFNHEWAAVAVDESHKVFGSLTIVRGNLAGKGLKRLKIKSNTGACTRIAISGTPFGRGGRIQGMFGTLHWLWSDEFTSFWKWVGMHFEVEEERVSRERTAKKIGPLKGGKDEEHFLKQLGPRILRRTKAEVLPNLPPKERFDVWCEPTPAQAKQQQRLADDGEIVGPSGHTTVDGMLAYITRGKQLADGVVDVKDGKVIFTGESGKVDQLWQMMEERGISKVDPFGDTKIIIASQFNEFLYAIMDRLDKDGIKYVKITGSDSDTARDRAMAIFQGGQRHTRVMLLNSKAGGVSITLDAADEVHMLDTMWDPGDNEQLEDRAHRASRMHHVRIFRYITEGSIDDSIAGDVEGRRFQQYRVLDQSRDVAYARALIKGKKVEA